MVQQRADELSQRLLFIHGNSVLHAQHPAHQRVTNMIRRLMAAQKATRAKECPRIGDRQWTVAVIASSKMGAFALPNGLLLFYMGILELGNDHQAAAIIGHEMAHCVQRHANEGISVSLACDIALLVPTVVTWAVLPFFQAMMVYTAVQLAAQLCILLPHSRVLEIEADRHGVMLAANACLDPVEACRFWAKIAILSGETSSFDYLAWLSTHPSAIVRFRRLSELIPTANAIRKVAGC